jgi:hypothetical protein
MMIADPVESADLPATPILVSRTPVGPIKAGPIAVGPIAGEPIASLVFRRSHSGLELDDGGRREGVPSQRVAEQR